VSLPHFFAGAPPVGETLELGPEDARHAVRSLRLGPGDRLTSGDGRGAVAVCRIEEAGRGRVLARVEAREEHPAPGPEVSVLLAPPKGERLAWAIQKLTEVGTDRIVLVEADRSVRRWSGERAGKGLERARGIAREAAKQSRRPFLPEVEGPLPWNEAMGEAASRGPLVLLWEEATRGLASAIPQDPPAAISVAVGPEGGITEREARDAEARGASVAALGTTILRTETAALAAASIVLSRYGRLGDRGEPLDPGGPRG